jgi:hypothetical protein
VCIAELGKPYCLPDKMIDTILWETSPQGMVIVRRVKDKEISECLGNNSTGIKP